MGPRGRGVGMGPRIAQIGSNPTCRHRLLIAQLVRACDCRSADITGSLVRIRVERKSFSPALQGMYGDACRSPGPYNFHGRLGYWWLQTYLFWDLSSVTILESLCADRRPLVKSSPAEPAPETLFLDAEGPFIGSAPACPLVPCQPWMALTFRHAHILFPCE